MDHVPYLIENNPTVLDACKQWEAQAAAANAARWAFVEEVGGVGYRGGHGIQSVMFSADRDVPEPWRPIRGQAGDIKPGTVECRPNARTKEGKALRARMSEEQYIDRFPREVAEAMGHAGRTVDGRAGKIARARVACLKRPKTAYVVILPLLEDQQFTPPEGCRELTRSEFVALVEAHNAAVEDEKKAA